MQMKFSQLTVGQRFQWQGGDYIKLNSLMARHEGTNKQEMVPRYSEVEVGGGDHAPPAPAPERNVAVSAVRNAFEDFYATAAEHTDAAGVEALATARQRFLDALAG